MDYLRPNTTSHNTSLNITTKLPNSGTTSSLITNVQTYKYLSITFDLKLSWKVHISCVIANSTRWAQQLWCIAKTAGGLPPDQTWQLYTTVAVLAFTYVSDI